MDAKLWLKREKERLADIGQLWTKKRNRVYGELIVPAEGIEASAPLVLPLRTSIRGNDTYTRDQRPDIITTKKFPLGDPILAWKPSRSQGSFSQRIDNLSIGCADRADGPVFDGDQGGSISNLTVFNPFGIGLYLRTPSHGVTLLNCVFEGTRHKKDSIGILAGGAGKPAHFTILGGSLNNFSIGLFLRKCYAIAIAGLSLENVQIIASVKKCTDIHAHGLLAKRCGPVLAEASWRILFRGCQRDSIDGTARNTPKPFELSQ